MALFEGKTPAERNKLIAAIAVGAIALFLVGRMFLGGSSTPTPTARRTSRNANQTNAGNGTAGGGNAQSDPLNDPTLQVPRELVYTPVSYNVPDAGRNIFAFYVPPVLPTPVPVVTIIPTPTPTPPPPLALNSVAPASVFARSPEFVMQVSGDKFTPEARVYLDGQELPTTFASAQQLSANVPAALISAPGARQIVVRTPDNTLYSDEKSLTINPAPVPPFTFVGILGGTRYNDKAILKNQSNELVTVQRGDLVGGRFKVTSISVRNIEFVDAQLQIKHTLPFVENRAAGGPPNGPSPRYTPVAPTTDDSGDDEEPQD